MLWTAASGRPQAYRPPSHTLRAPDTSLGCASPNRSPAAALFGRFYDEASGESPNVDIKERWKLLAKINNMKQLGLGSFFEKYNGKPALITKSGSVYRGHDYLEVCNGHVTVM